MARELFKSSFTGISFSIFFFTSWRVQLVY